MLLLYTNIGVNDIDIFTKIGAIGLCVFLLVLVHKIGYNIEKGGFTVLKYDKLFAVLEAAGITATKIRAEKIMSQDTYYKLKRGEPADVRTSTIDKLCALLGCQPGDLMEYVPDPTEDDQMPE